MAGDLFKTSATYQDLERFLPGPECAVCRCGAQAEQRYFDALLYENVVSTVTAARMRASNGFCTRHIETLLSYRDPMGTAILYGYILQERRRQLAKWQHAHLPSQRVPQAEPGAAHLGARGAQCPACDAEHGAERRACEVLAAGLDTGLLREGWRRSEGLCWPHFVGTRGLCHHGRADLDDWQSLRLDQLAEDTEHLIGSFSYQWHGERSPRVESAWRRVVSAMAGRFQGGKPKEEPRPADSGRH